MWSRCRLCCCCCRLTFAAESSPASPHCPAAATTHIMADRMKSLQVGHTPYLHARISSFVFPCILLRIAARPTETLKLFIPPKLTRHRQDSFVVSGVAVWISFNTHGTACIVSGFHCSPVCRDALSVICAISFKVCKWFFSQLASLNRTKKRKDN